MILKLGFKGLNLRWFCARMAKQQLSNLASGQTTVGLIQLTCTPDKDSNYDQARRLIQRAAEKGAKMVFLPECFDFVSLSRAQTVELAESLSGPVITKYRELSKELGVWLSLGGFHEKPADFEKDKLFYNTHVIVNDSGDIVETYRKIHLFDVDIPGKVQLKETHLNRPGPEITPPVLTPVGRVGLMICYDLRFPEQSIALTQQNAEILTYPSAFTVPTGMAHWEVLLRARATENQCYVVAAAQVGRHHEKRSSYGHAMVIDPWGCKLAECHDQPDVAVVDLNLDYLRQKRLEMPIWEHRRRDLYGTVQTYSCPAVDSVRSYTFGRVPVPSSAVFCRTSLSYAFVNRKPVQPGHVLLSPIREVARFSDLTDAETADLWTLAKKISPVIEKVNDASSLTFTIQDGEDAGQSIKHVHIHILPRRPGDFTRNDDVYHALEDHDKDVAPSAWRTDDDMALEAAELRKHFM